MIDVTIIIVNYNTREMTAACIDSIFEKTSGISIEVILVDNASNDDSKEYFEKDTRILYIYNNENLGFGKANNKGLEVAKGRNILFLNSDTLLINNAVKILSDYLDKNKEVGICGGNLFGADMQPNHSYKMFYPSIIAEINNLFWGIPTKLLKTDRSQFNRTGKPKEVAYITGADLMIKKELLEKYGGFNPAFFMYFEETELCHRIKTAGFRIVSVPDAQIIHFGGKSTKKKSTKKRSRNTLFLASKKEYYKITHNSNILSRIFEFFIFINPEG